MAFRYVVHGSAVAGFAIKKLDRTCDTLFANMTLAYDTLSDGMKKLIADMHGIHLSGTAREDLI